MQQEKMGEEIFERIGGGCGEELVFVVDRVDLMWLGAGERTMFALL